MSISLGGLASNLDTAGMISKLMELERIPYTNLERKKSNLAAEQGIFRTINTKVSALKTAIADLKLSSTFKQISAKSSDDSVVRVSSGDYATAGTYNVEVKQIASAQTISLSILNTNPTNPPEDPPSIKMSFKIGDSLFSTTKDGAEGLADLRDQINEGKHGVSAAVISLGTNGSNPRLVLTKTETGADNQIVIDQADEFNGLNFEASESKHGNNARIVVNGFTVDRRTNEFKDVIQGVTFNVSKANGTAIINIASDTDKITSKVESFVNAYNDLISTVRENLKPPADKSKVNPLQGDSVLKSISDQAYRAVTDLIGDVNDQNSFSKFLSEVGLDIDKGITKASLMTGKITFDKEKFKSAIEDNFDGVVALFNNVVTKIGEDSKDVTDTTKSGFIHRLDEVINSWNNAATGFINTKIKGYDSEISVVDDRLERMSLQIDQKYERLKKQYTAMEVALSSLNSQKSWMTSQLAALTASTQK